MIGVSVALQALSLVLFIVLAFIALIAGRRLAAGLRAHLAQLESRLAALETRTAADEDAIAELRERATTATALATSSALAAAIPDAALPAGSLSAAVIPAEIVALLTAAAYAAIGKPVVLHYALVIGEDQGGTWRTAGRAEIFASHKIR